MALRNSAIAFLLIFSASCSTSVDLEAPWQDIPVVYGLISRQDTAHYIRIEKAFLTDGKDAAEVAQILDSLYYPSLGVELEKVSTGQRYPLLRVDGALEGYPRAEGPFATSPNYLYKIKGDLLKLQGGEALRLRIFRPGTLAPTIAETTVLSDLAPRETSPSNPVNMGYDRQVAISWTAPAAAQVFDVLLRIRYRESSSAQLTSFVHKSVDWVLAGNLLRTDNTDRVSVVVEGRAFYAFLAKELTAAPNVRRIFDGMDLVVSAGGKEFADALRLSQANTGITSTQWTPVYTNIEGGRGMFSSRTSVVRPGLQLSAPSMDSLRWGSLTRELNFQ
jgi:hypothetical protein